MPTQLKQVEQAEEVVAKVTDLFWHQGYDETSVEDLVRGTVFSECQAGM